MRNFTASIAAPILKATGYRFDKSWRQADTGAKAFVFRWILNTTGANIKAGI